MSFLKKTNGTPNWLVHKPPTHFQLPRSVVYFGFTKKVHESSQISAQWFPQLLPPKNHQVKVFQNHLNTKQDFKLPQKKLELHPLPNLLSLQPKKLAGETPAPIPPVQQPKKSDRILLAPSMECSPSNIARLQTSAAKWFVPGGQLGWCRLGVPPS